MTPDKFSTVLKIVAENGYLGPRELIRFSLYIGREHQILAWRMIMDNYKKEMADDVRPEGIRTNFHKEIDICRCC